MTANIASLNLTQEATPVDLSKSDPGSSLVIPREAVPFTEDFDREDSPYLGLRWRSLRDELGTDYAILTIEDNTLYVDHTSGESNLGIGGLLCKTFIENVTITVVGVEDTAPADLEFSPGFAFNLEEGDADVAFGIWPAFLGVGAALYGALGNPPSTFKVYALAGFDWDEDPKTIVATWQSGLITSATVDGVPLVPFEVRWADSSPTGTTNLHAVAAGHSGHAGSILHGALVDTHNVVGGDDVIPIGSSITIEEAAPITDQPYLTGGITTVGSVSSGNNLALVAPDGTREGDLLVAVIYINNITTTISSVGAAFAAGGSSAQSHGQYRVFTRVAQDGDAGDTFNFLVATAGSSMRGTLLSFANASGIEGYTAEATHASGGSGTLPAVTTLGANRLLTGVLGQEAAAATMTTDPATWTIHREDQATTPCMQIVSLRQAAAGISTARAYLWDTSGQGGSFAFAVKP